MTADILITLFRQVLDEGWGYIWGRSGQVWTAANQKAATRAMTVKYGSKWIGRRVADCSGLFAWAFKQCGESIYHGSNTIWKKHCSSQGTLTPGMSLKPGTAVFLVKNGNRHHIGLFVGDNTVIEAKGTAYGVVTSTLSRWDEWGELKAVSYSDEKGEAAEMTIRKGSTGEVVTALQNRLIALGYDIAADGIFGQKTENAVRMLQASKGLTADGICGPNTWAALGEGENTPKQPDTGDSGASDTITLQIPRTDAEAIQAALKSLLAHFNSALPEATDAEHNL